VRTCVALGACKHHCRGLDCGNSNVHSVHADPACSIGLASTRTAGTPDGCAHL